MIELHRTASDVPKAIFQIADQLFMTKWSSLLDLRELVAAVPPEAVNDENYSQEYGEWAASGSTSGMILTTPDDTEIPLNAEDWKELYRLLYVGDDLLMPTEVAEIIGKVQSHVSIAISAGRLFAFKVPKWKTRQWRIPRRAVQEWLE